MVSIDSLLLNTLKFSMITVRNTEKTLSLRIAGFLLGFFLYPLLVIGANSGFEIQPYVQNISKSSATISWKSAEERGFPG